MLGAKAIYGQSWAEDLTSVTQQGGVTEAAIFAQRQILRTRRNALAIKLGAGHEGADVAGFRTGEANGAEFLDARLLYGRDISARPIKVFVAAEGGLRERFDGLADQWRGEAQIGIEPTQRLLVLIGAEAIIAAGDASPSSGGYDLAKAGAAFVYRASRRIRLSVGARQEFGLRNISDGRGFHIGLWTEF